MPVPKGTLLPAGCYFLKYEPDQEIEQGLHFDGVLRHTPENPRIQASADLYEHRVLRPAGSKDTFPNPPPCEELPKGVMPVLPPETYRYYFRMQQVCEGSPDDKSVSLVFQVHHFDGKSKRFGLLGGRTAILRKHGAKSLAGGVFDEQTGQHVGKLTITHITEAFVRQAVVQIDSAEDEIQRPVDNGDNRDWKGVFKDCLWTLEVTKSKALKPRAKGLPWTDAELHKKMQESNGAAKGSELEWRYHLLCVGTFANPQYERGVMYDVAGADLNQAPREGAAIAGEWSMEGAGWPMKWEKLRGKKVFQQAKDLYFRTALHEIGHAMGLEHNHDTAHLMNTTDALERDCWIRKQQSTVAKEQAYKEGLFARVQANALEKMVPGSEDAKKLRAIETTADQRLKDAEKAETAASFPPEIQWGFSDRDRDHLQHGPDVMVRPGAFVEGTVGEFGDTGLKLADGLELVVTSLLPSVPRGAPVRVKLTLRNKSDRDQEVPLTLHLKSGNVEGSVIGPGGTPVRPFYPLLRGMDSDRLRTLKPGEVLHHSMTLLRGHEGELFTRAGDHTVRVRVSWHRPGNSVYLESETQVRIEPGGNTPHLLAALNLLGSLEALIGLVTGAGDPAVDACRLVPELRPHYAVLELKKLLEKPDLAEALKVLQEEGDKMVASISEINRLKGLLEDLVKAGKASADQVKPLLDLLDLKHAALELLER